MAIGSGPGKGKKKQTSTQKHYRSKDGQTVAAPGYKMGLLRNERDTKTPTKKITTGTGPTAVTRVQQQGIIAPIPAGPGGKVAATPKKKTAAGKVIKKIGRDIDYAVGTVKNALKPSVQKRGTFKGNKRGGKIGEVCAAYFGYPTRRRR